MTTLQSGLSRRIIRVASKPSIRGMLMSISARSGWSWLTFSMASIPSLASPQKSSTIKTSTEPISALGDFLDPSRCVDSCQRELELAAGLSPRIEVPICHPQPKNARSPEGSLYSVYCIDPLVTFRARTTTLNRQRFALQAGGNRCHNAGRRFLLSSNWGW